MSTLTRDRAQVRRAMSVDSALPRTAEVRMARATLARHRRRRYPDRLVCGFCGGVWRRGVTYTKKPAAGCFRRRQAIEVLDVAGHLDSHGRLVWAVRR